LVGGELLEAHQLVADAGGLLEIEPFSHLFHLGAQQLLKFVAAALEHHRHLAQGALVIL